MEKRKIISPVLAALLILGVGYGIWHSNSQKTQSQQQEAASAAMQTLKIVSGSETVPYLNDLRVISILSKNGIQLAVQKAGSREIAQRPDIKQFDAALTGGVPAAEKIKSVTGAKQIIATFYTPMVIASWSSLIPVLEANGLVKKENNVHYIVDMAKLIELMQNGTRWKELKNNKTFSVGKSILVSTTDVRKSNSAAQYLALTSWIINGGNVVTTEAEVENIFTKISPLFVKQGYQENTSTGPFDNYLAMGIGAVPLVMIYESQYLEFAIKSPTVNPDMVLLYPTPTVFSKRMVVPLNAKGDKFAQLLASDPELQKIAAEYGLRSNNPQLLVDALAAKKLPPPPTLNDVVEAPTFEILEKMITRLESQMN